MTGGQYFDLYSDRLSRNGVEAGQVIQMIMTVFLPQSKQEPGAMWPGAAQSNEA